MFEFKEYLIMLDINIYKSFNKEWGKMPIYGIILDIKINLYLKIDY